MPGVGFLHTAEAHVETFGALMAELAPSLRHRHLVEPRLLERARDSTDGDDDALRDEVRAALAQFQRVGVDVVLCTCSTIGDVAETGGLDVGLRVLRVDRPMAELAVRKGHNVAIVAALESTLAPTRKLLRATARAANVTVSLTDAPCLDAWALFEAGAVRSFHRAVAAHLDTLDPAFDLAVLAQASMAPAANLTRSQILVLASPRLGVAEACRSAR